MADFGIIEHVRSLLKNSDSLNTLKIENNIHMAIPAQQNYPMVMIELEEIWTTENHALNSPIAKIKFRTSTFSKKNSPTESLEIAENIRKEVDGKVIALSGGKTAIFKLESSVIDTPVANKMRCINQYYEGIVRA